VPTALPTTQIRVVRDGQAVLHVAGQIGHAYDILATQDFKTRTVIGTVKVGASGSFEFIAPNAASCLARYYRAREKP
jgi:hypothetical protein